MQSNDDYIKEPTGVKYQSLYISYKSILQDFEEAMNWMHNVSLHYFIYICVEGVNHIVEMLF